MPTSAKFWDDHAEGYSKRPIKDMKSYEAALARTRSYLKPSDNVLEIGSGTGGTARLIAPYVDRITASDISAGMTEISRSRAQEEGINNIKCIDADANDSMLEGHSFDAVLAHNLLHLVPDLNGTVSQAHAALKPGGLFISKTPCLGSARIWLRLLLKSVVPMMQLFGKAPYVNAFTVRKLDGAIARAGFDIIETAEFPKGGMGHYVVARRR